MKKTLLLFTIISFIFCFVSCKENNPQENTSDNFFVTDIYVPTYHKAIQHTSTDANVYYLSENDNRNNKLTIVFNKEISKDNEDYLFYIQTGSEIPIIPESEKSEIRYDIYSISGNTLEISYFDKNNNKNYYVPPSLCGLYIPKEFKAEDGSTLNETFEVYFSGTNPHDLLESTTSYNGSPETITIDKFGDRWNYLYGKTRDVGFVNCENVPLYGGDEIIDTLTIADNVEILGEDGEYYNVNVYRPLALDDKNHHSNYLLSSKTDIFDSVHLNKITGKIDKKYINTIELSKNYSRVSVYSSSHQNYYGLSDVFVWYSIFPSGSSTFMLKENIPLEAELPDDFVDTKPLNSIKLDSNIFSLMELLSYNYFAGIYGDGWVKFDFYNDEVGNYSYPIENFENHRLLNRYPQERSFVQECTDLYNSYVEQQWQLISAPQGYEKEKEAFDSYIECRKIFSKIWYEWSEIDKDVTRDTYIQLIKKYFANDDENISAFIDECFINDNLLQSCIARFVDEKFWPIDIINETNEKLKIYISDSSEKSQQR